MKIGMMADIYKTQVSGVTNSIALSKEWMEKQGHEVYIFTFGDDDVIDHEQNIIRTTGVPVVDTGIYLNLRYNRHARKMLFSMDITHVHHPFLSGSLAMHYCVPRNIPIVFTNHTRYDLLTQVYLPILPETIGEAALKAYLAPFYRACNLVIVPSPRMKEVLKDHFGLDSPVEVIPNGVDLTPFKADIQPIDRSQFGFTTDDVISTYVGRLSPEKNLLFLLRSFYGVAMTHNHARLLIVGDGPERDNLEAQVRHMNITNKVYFTGMVDYKDVPAFLASSDIFITASRSETFGLSTVEAMAAGLPVLGLDAVGTGDIIEDGFTGYLAIDDLAVFTAKLMYLSTNHELRREMGNKAKQASEKYDIESTTSILINRYEQLIEHAKRYKKGPHYRLTKLLDRFK